MTKVSIITTACRPGGLDITLAGFRDQIYKDIEFIVVDKRYSKRHKEIKQLAKDYGLNNFLHIPEHRLNGNWTTFCSAWNTGMALATGDIFIFLGDWTYIHPNLVEGHLEAHKTPNRYVLAPYIYTELPELTKPYPYDKEKQHQRHLHCTEIDDVISGGILDEVFAFKDGPFNVQWIPQLKIRDFPHQDIRFSMLPTSQEIHLAPNVVGWVHIKHESISRELAHRLNGLDERLERGKGPMDTDFEVRLDLAGASLWWDTMIPPGISPNPRWHCRTMPWGDMTQRLENRWSFEDGSTYIAHRKRAIISATTKEEKDQLIQSKNPYTLEGLANRLASWKNGDEPKPIDVDDLTYWGRDIWPDTDDASPIHNSQWPSQKSSSICKTCLQNTFIELGGVYQSSYHPNIHTQLITGVNWIWNFINGSIPLHNNHADRIKTINFLDQFSTETIEKLLEECYRVLKMSGVLFIQLTDLDWIAENPDLRIPQFAHLKSGFTQSTLTVLLKKIGFRHIVFAGRETEHDFRMNAIK